MDTLLNIRTAYRGLEDRVTTALRTQIGDCQRLGIAQDEVLALRGAVEAHKGLFSDAEISQILQNLKAMVQALDNTRFQSLDPPVASLAPLSHLSQTAGPGRPSIRIDPEVLQAGLALEPKTVLANMIGCSTRTVRRRQKELEEEAGTPLTPRQTEITNNELDTVVREILHRFPNFGRAMVMGRLNANGYNIPEHDVRASIERVRGAPSRFFGSRRIHRRKYYVPAVNSLWHHDGQHSLIRWKIVIHGFIDGKTRFIVGLRAHSNNRADTVLLFFLEIIKEHGCPSRLRGDHGVENVRVAEFMEETMGQNRGSYIWGRSVHNTRIERLWYDVTEGFGRQWKDLFYSLETHHGLDVEDPSHIWLLHWLFLPAINEDATTWATAWNSHKIQLEGERRKSPCQLYLRSCLTDGIRGLPPSAAQPEDDQIHDTEPEDYATYGVDWEAIDDPHLMDHLRENNPEEEGNTPSHQHPAWINEVICEPPDCPLTEGQIDWLEGELAQTVDCRSKDMEVRRLVWVTSLELYAKLCTEHEYI